MKSKKLILLAVGLVLLYSLQSKVVQPILLEIAASDLFLVESKDEANPMPISNDMTALAFTQCNSYINSKLDSDTTISFPSQPTNAWSIGNYEYIINAEVELSSKDAPSAVHHYVCRIQYSNGDDLAGASDINNWSIEGLTGLPDL